MSAVLVSLSPLLLSTLLLTVALLLPRFFRAWPLWVRLIWHVAFFAALTFALERVFGSPLDPAFTQPHMVWQQVLEAGWWLIGAQVAIGSARLLVVLDNRPRETQIISDLLAGAIYVATFLAVINFALTVPVRGLLATSGVIAIVLGLALQTTLSDVFSGIAVGLERPYKAGDLLWVEGDIEGQVLQVDWRSTQIATGDQNIAIVPNSVIAKARLINRSAPTPMRGSSLEIRLDARVPPERCIASLTAAARACRILLSAPPPRIACTGLNGDGGVYQISFVVPSSDQLASARTELLGKIHRHVRHDGIALAIAGNPEPPAVGMFDPAQLLAQSDLFCVIEPAQRDLLAQHFTPIWLQAGEVLVSQGEMADALFVIASGTVEITVEKDGAKRMIYRMSPGESLGAVGLITGSPYGTTATALTPVKAYKLVKTDIAAAIAAKPELKTGLEALAQRGLAALRSDVAAQHNPKMAEPEMLLGRIRNFLRLLSR
jgi:small-conductance mechanosensitive channel/CRP-like cAMP-binding protein